MATPSETSLVDASRSDESGSDIGDVHNVENRAVRSCRVGRQEEEFGKVDFDVSLGARCSLPMYRMNMFLP